MIDHEPADDGGHFGTWVRTTSGEDAFEVAAPPERAQDLVLPAGGWGAMWHQVGSPGITATASVDGCTQVWATARGMVRLTGPTPQGRGALAPTVVHATRWEHAAASWDLAVGDAVVRRRVAAAPDDAAALHIEVQRLRGGPATLRWVEGWAASPYPLLVGGLMSHAVPAPPGAPPADRAVWRLLYGASDASRRATDAARRALARRLRMRPVHDPDRGAVVWHPRTTCAPVLAPAWYDEALPYLVVAGLGEGWWIDRHELWTDLGDQPQHAVVLLLEDLDELDDALEAARSRAAVPDGRRTEPWLTLDMPHVPWLERETGWHATYLRGALQHDAWFDRAYVSQGSAYSYVHGLQGAPRDYAIFAVPLTYIDPAAARGQLEVVMQMTSASGAIEYAHTGRGQCTSGGIHAAPTDLPLFLLWAVTEHVWATGDRTWLDVRVPFRPGRSGVRDESSVRDRLLLAWHRLRDRVGLGPTGLVRVGSGDWADPISAMVPDRRAFHERGESVFNTAFAAYVLPRAADLVQDTAPEEAAAMRAWGATCAEAAAATWNGRWFLRGIDGCDGPVGDDHLFVDANALCLLAQVGSEAQRRTLIDEIAARCIQPSPIGATILDRPHPVRFGMLAPGWDCNGGVWAAVNAFATMGIAAHDPAIAWDLVLRQSLTAHARAYPDVWFGIWSGPDAYNAHFGSRPGETFVQPATPMTEYPVMNANAHAGPLLALLAALGVTTHPGGVRVEPRPAPVPEHWQLRTALGTFHGGAEGSEAAS